MAMAHTRAPVRIGRGLKRLPPMPKGNADEFVPANRRVVSKDPLMKRVRARNKARSKAERARLRRLRAADLSDGYTVQGLEAFRAAKARGLI